MHKIEIWKDVVGYEGLYQISNLGRVKSLPRMVGAGNGYLSKERMLEICVSRNGYLFVPLCKNGKRKNHRIHRLIAQSFIPNPENKTQVNHIDHDIWNNNLDNLEWVTQSENMKHSFSNPKRKKPNVRGDNNPNSKLNLTKAEEIKNQYKSGLYTQKELGNMFGVGQGQISRIILNKVWSK